MASPKIVLYDPNPTPRSRRIDAKEWETHRPRLEALYIKDDKKLEEVMEAMALYEAFHASRRQYTQKFNEWGWCKNFPAKVMKCALLKRAKAGKDGLSFKYRGTAIAEGNMDRWQQRAPTFDPFSSPTASTPSQMNIESPYMVNSEHQGNAIQLPATPSLPIDHSHNSSLDGYDAVRISYDDISRSVSPRIAEYIFQPMSDGIASNRSDTVRVGWTTSAIKSLTKYELTQLTENDTEKLLNLSGDLWSFGGMKCMNYYTHICEVLFARESLLGSKSVLSLSITRFNLSIAYLEIGRTSEAERFLIDSIAEIDSVRPGDPQGANFRSYLGRVYMEQEQCSQAEVLCTQATKSLRSTVGLSHSWTWSAYRNLSIVFKAQERPNDGERLMLHFYRDIYQTVSAQLLPGLRTSFQLCRKYIEKWMPGSKMEILARHRYMSDCPPDIVERFALILGTVICERYKEEQETVPQVIKDMQDMTGLRITRILSRCALLIFKRSWPIKSLDSISLRQEALAVVEDLVSEGFLVPLWIHSALNYAPSSACRFTQLKDAEQRFFKSLKVAVTSSIQLTEASDFTTSTNAVRPESASVIEKSHAILQYRLLNDSEQYTGSTTDVQPPSVENSTSLNVVPLNYQLWPVPDIEVPATSPFPSQDAEPSFSQLASSAPAQQLWRNGPSNNPFLPTIVENPTPPLTFDFLQTLQASHMLLPPRPVQDSIASAPSFVLREPPDLAASWNLFRLPQSPLPPSSFFRWGQSPSS